MTDSHFDLFNLMQYSQLHLQVDFQDHNCKNNNFYKVITKSPKIYGNIMMVADVNQNCKAPVLYITVKANSISNDTMTNQNFKIVITMIIRKKQFKLNNQNKTALISPIMNSKQTRKIGTNMRITIVKKTHRKEFKKIHLIVSDDTRNHHSTQNSSKSQRRYLSINSLIQRPMQETLGIRKLISYLHIISQLSNCDIQTE